MKLKPVAAKRPAAPASITRSKTAARSTTPAQTNRVDKVTLAKGCLWKMADSSAVVYVTDAALAGELFGADAKRIGALAMAVYFDKKGKAFAWQFRFDVKRWNEIRARLTESPLPTPNRIASPATDPIGTTVPRLDLQARTRRITPNAEISRPRVKQAVH